MTSGQRQDAADGLFCANGPIGNRVLLIDDVVCTGAQAIDAARALREAGAIEIRLVALARAIAMPEDRSRRVAYDRRVADPVVTELLAIEPVALDEPGSRRALVRWSDGTTSEALRFYDDEVLFCEGDLIGKTQAQLHSLHFQRDRDHLQY
jgi:hypothetical protein